MPEMRTLISLIENANMITPEMLTRAIMDVTQDWLATKRVKNVRQIGNGHCYDFARAVMDALGASGYGDYFDPQRTGVSTVRTEDFEKREWYADLAKLRRIGEPLPKDIPTRLLAELIGSASHEWLYLDGKHYDATAPQGVRHMLDLPFFKDQIEGLRRELAANRK